MEQIAQPNREKHAAMLPLCFNIFTQAVCKSVIQEIVQCDFKAPGGLSLKPRHGVSLFPPKSDGVHGLDLSDISHALRAITPRDRPGLKIDTAQRRTSDVNDISISKE